MKSLIKLYGVFFIFISHAYADFVDITVPIASDFGSIAGFETEDPSLVYKVPKTWEVYENNFYQDGNDFYFAIAPQYDNETLARYKLENPEKIILPIPHILSESTLFLADIAENESLLGKISNAVTPDNLINQSDLIYYKINVHEEALETFTTIVESVIGLTGYVSMSYPYESQILNTQIPFFIRMDSIREVMPDNYSSLWVQRVLTEKNCLQLDQFIQGKINLGFFSVDLLSEESRSCWMTDNLEVLAGEMAIYHAGAMDLSLPNIYVNSNLIIPQLGIIFESKFNLQVAVTIDLLSLTVTIENLTFFEIIGEDISPEYKIIIENIFEPQKPQVMSYISEVLTEELRIRIVNGNIFL
ncbi:MAG: hypothetical protein AAGB12_07475 [Pseudomonadota bacterium]